MGYSSVKLKVNLQLSIQRLKALQKKQDNANILARKEVAELLRRSKIDLARIKVEGIIRDDYYQEALEILETYCSLLLTRFGLIESVKYCDPGIRKAVCTIIWSTPRVSVDVTEFNEISKQLRARYGKDFADAALQDVSKEVCPRVADKLSFVVPERRLVDSYLTSIGEFYGVSYTPPVDIDPTFPDVFGSNDGYNGGGDLLHAEQLPPPPVDDMSKLAFPSPVNGSPYPPQQTSTAPSQAQYAFPPQAQPQQQYPPQAQQQYPPQPQHQPQQQQQFASPPPQQQQQQQYPPAPQIGASSHDLAASFPMPPSATQPQQYSPQPQQQPPSYADSNASGLLPPTPPGAPTADPFPSLPNAPMDTSASMLFPSPPGMSSTSAGTDSDLDDLARRFDALRK
eukprot:m.241500 g.241500  ORF g.241500 m.241500 type:complete len:397 (+) comp15326_c1_seq1:532-1722(+)